MKEIDPKAGKKCCTTEADTKSLLINVPVLLKFETEESKFVETRIHHAMYFLL